MARTTYIGGGRGITKGGFVSMRNPSELGRVVEGQTSRGGGSSGGGGGTSSLTAEQQAAQAKARAEAKAKAEAEAKAKAEAEAKAKEKLLENIKSKTLGGQLNVDKINGTSTGKPDSKVTYIGDGRGITKGGFVSMRKPTVKSGVQVTPVYAEGSAGSQYQFTGKASGGAQSSSWIANLIGEVTDKNIKQVGDVQAPPMQGTYTGVYNPKTKQYDIPTQYQGQTLDDEIFVEQLKEQAEVAKAEKETLEYLNPIYGSKATELASTYQSKIDTGELTYEQATKEYETGLEDLNKQFQTSANVIFGEKVNSLDLGSSWESKYEKASKSLPKPSGAIVTGGLIAASLWGGAPAVGASLLVGSEGVFTTYKGLEEKNPLKVVVGVATTALGAYGAGKGTSNLLTQRSVSQLSSQKPILDVGYRVSGKGGGFTDVFSYTQQTGKGVLKTTGAYRVGSTSSGGFEIVGGTVKSTGIVKDVWTGKPLTFGGTQDILRSPITTFPASQGITPTITDLTTRWTSSYSGILNVKNVKGGGYDVSGLINRQTFNLNPTTTPYGGFGFGNKKISVGASGKLKDYGYDEIFFSKGNKLDLGGKTLDTFKAVDTSSGSFSFPFESLSVRKVITPQTDIGVSFISGGGSSSGGGGGSSTSQILKQFYSGITPAPVGSTLSRTTTPTTALVFGSGTTTSTRTQGINIGVQGLQSTSLTQRDIVVSGSSVINVPKPPRTKTIPVITQGIATATITTPAIKPTLEPKLRIDVPGQRITPKTNFNPNWRFNPIIPVGFGSLNLKGKRLRKSQVKRQPLRYQSSVTASVFNIKGRSSFLGKSLGYNPFEIRGLDVPVSKKKKKSKKSKKKK